MECGGPIHKPRCLSCDNLNERVAGAGSDLGPPPQQCKADIGRVLLDAGMARLLHGREDIQNARALFCGRLAQGLLQQYGILRLKLPAAAITGF